MQETNSASQYFNDHWKMYQQTIKNNTLYHREMSHVLDSFLNNQFGSRPFSFVDVGCGDGSTIIDVLKDKPINHYIGIDAASEVLKLAEQHFSLLKGKKEFICGNMQDAINKIPAGVDVIFTSYAVHHLSYQQKMDFIRACHDKLNNNGFLLMIDGVLKKNQTRDQWLDALENRIKTTQHLSDDEINFRMQHPRSDDFPEEIAAFEKMAREQRWDKFSVLLEKEIYAFMMFAKGSV